MGDWYYGVTTVTVTSSSRPPPRLSQAGRVTEVAANYGVYYVTPNSAGAGFDS